MTTTFDLITVGAHGVTFANHAESRTLPRDVLLSLYRHADGSATVTFESATVGGKMRTLYDNLRCDDKAQLGDFLESLSKLEALIRGPR